MSILSGWGARGRALFSDNKGPWGAPPGGNGGEPPSGDEPSGPWGEPSKHRGRPTSVTSLDEFLKRSRGRLGGGGGGGFGLGMPSGSWLTWALIAIGALWLATTSMHSIAAEQRGVVTRFGRYSHTLGPGFSMTLPAPIDRVEKVDVDKNREIDLGTTGAETLMLTGDQNIIDIAYLIRWKIKNPEQFLFELKDPEATVTEVGESAMRAVIANVSLQGAMGNQRGEIEARVAEEMQRTLDSYQSGVLILGISLRQADPPAAVNDAFKDVTAAQQDAQSYINDANAYALQLRQKAQGDATAFDKVYEQYKLAPGVTKRRMYYETMERILQNVDKTIVETGGVTPYLPLGEVRRSPPRSAGQ